MASTSNVTLDDLDMELVEDTADTATSSVELPTHLTYPTYIPDEDPDTPQPQHQPQQPKQLLKDRLYVGNLHTSVDEYALLHIFSKFGKVTKLDFLFHKSGPLKGKPRGYAFIEYGKHEEAQKALSVAHGKLLRGRKLIVTYAQQAPLDQYPSSSSGTSNHRRPVMETGRPTTLSILKTGLVGRHGHEPKTADKIALMEAKLRQIEADKPEAAIPMPSGIPAKPMGSMASTSSSLPHHPSLPNKPPPPLPAHIAAALQSSRASAPSPSSGIPQQHRLQAKLKHPLPSLPLKPQVSSGTGTPLNPLGVPSASAATTPRNTGSTSFGGGGTFGNVNANGSKPTKLKGLAGVVIKPKTKAAEHDK